MAATILAAAMGGGCGRDVSRSADFVLGLSGPTGKDDSEAYGAYLADLVVDFNARAGRDVISLASDPILATSPVVLSAGLARETGFLGLGGQYVMKSTNPAAVSRSGVATRVELDLTMALRLDRDAFVAGAAEWAAGGRGATASVEELARLLFFHEVGHGLSFVHDEVDETAVMFPILNQSDHKDYDAFFVAVAAYFDSI